MQFYGIGNKVSFLWQLLRKTGFVLFFSVGLSVNAHAAPIISPLLADLSSDSYTSSGQYLGFSAENAFNGGQWNAGNYGWHWIQADLGSIGNLTQLKIMTAQTPNGVSQHQVFSSDSYIGNGYGSLTPIYSRSGFTTSGTVLDILFDTPQAGRFFLILTHGGPSWTAIGDSAGRVDWEQQVLGISAVPLPPALIAFSTAMFGIGVLIRRKKKRA